MELESFESCQENIVKLAETQMHGVCVLGMAALDVKMDRKGITFNAFAFQLHRKDEE